ncbi:MAG TPA: S41 family peptidase [Terracidiphilus sp.]|jgi:hypothetical protein|nr:S41 family peptidase [Terracidiphilus sp.]
MSEWIYSFLLRLYPAQFRERFEGEALQLLRDRLGEERGALRRLRLWMDLFADMALGLPQAYRNSYALEATAPGWAAAHAGFPAFRMLEQEPLRPSSVALGSMVATGTLALFVFVMGHVAAYHPSSNFLERLNAAAGSERNPDAQAVAERLERQLGALSRQQECSFEKLELHPGNIGYVKLRWFANPALCGDVAEAVMSRLGQTDAVIFDLRDTRGGYPEMVRMMAGALFDHPVEWYNPRATSPAELKTVPLTSGNGLASKPVFILTSSNTFSGAEHFAYNLKTMKRATIVGETTSGASHGPPGAQAARQADVKPVWEGTGVQPDVHVDADHALAVAEKLALDAIQKK